MTQVTKWGYLVVLAVWVGSIVFFSLVAAPTIFRALTPENAGVVIRRMFPHYYLLGISCAGAGIVLAALLLAAQALRPGAAILSLLLLAGMGAADVWMRQAVMPRMNELRQRVADAKAGRRGVDGGLEKEWQTMHRLSVQVNGAVLLGGLALLLVFVYARAV